MSSPAYTWGDIVQKLLDGIQAFFYEAGAFIAENAKAIAQAVLGVGLAFGIGTAVYRLLRPMVGRFVRFY